MKTVNVYEAKTHLSQLLDLAASGEEVVIARAGRPWLNSFLISRMSNHGNLGIGKARSKLPRILIFCPIPF